MYEKHNAYYFVDTHNKWHRLSAVRDGMPAMYRALATLQEAHAATGDTMPAVIAKWVKERVQDWRPSTKRNMERVASELATAFAEYRPADIKTPDCAQYLATLKATPRTHNIHRNVLHQLLAWAAVQGMREGHNPVDNVRGLSTPPRKRVVQPHEVQAIQAAAKADRHPSSAGPALACMMDMALITGQRIGDLLAMRWDHLGDGGIAVTQGKTGASMLITWTPALRAAVEQCAALGRADFARTGYLLKTHTGSGYTYSGMRSAWVRYCRKAGVKGLTVHDLRGAAGVEIEQTQGREAARKLLGHATQRTTAIYTSGKHVPSVMPAK